MVTRHHPYDETPSPPGPDSGREAGTEPGPAGGRPPRRGRAAIPSQAAPPVQGRAARRKARKRRNRRRRVLLPLAVGAGLLLLTGVSAAYVTYSKLDGNIRTDPVKGKLSADRPDVGGDGTGRPMNLLVIGSDSRAGGNRALGGGGDHGERSDTTLFVHFTSHRERAVVMSIPRDLLVTVPPCVTRDGTRSPERYGVMFNSAFELGGAACTRNTVEALTRMRVDHHLILDFTGFKDMVDAVGGVEICLPRAVYDRSGNISLPAGRRRVGGEEALDYVRLRHDVSLGGDGSDLGRIKRQQAFVSSLAREIRGSEVLFSPGRMYALADAMTRSIRADEGLDSVRDLVGLGRTLRDLEARDITFVSLPVDNPPEDRNRVVLVQPDARRLFAAVNRDEPLDGRNVTPPPAGASGTAPRASARPLGGSPAATAPEPAVRAVTRNAEQDICQAN